MTTLVFCSGGTLPDYLHRPYLFRRGELSRFFFGVSWGVFHTELCLIIYIVRTSLGGESYRVFFSGFPRTFFTRNSAWFWTVWDFSVVFHNKMSDRFCLMADQMHDKMSENPWQNEWKSMTKWVKKGTRGHPWAPKGAKWWKTEKMELIWPPRERGCQPFLHNFAPWSEKKRILSDLLGYQFATPFSAGK